MREAVRIQPQFAGAGLHCAPLAHESAGTLETGTVRFSLSAFNTDREIFEAAKIMRSCLA